MDYSDQATASEELFRALAIQSKRKRNSLTSATHCQVTSCGVPIPEARQEAVRGCQYCFDCQDRLERSHKGRA